MTVKISKPALNIREELSNLKKPSGVAGEAILRAETPQEQQALIGVGRRNLVINGANQVNQRGTVTGINTAAFTYGGPDRRNLYVNDAGGAAFTISQGTSGPEEFTHTCRIDCTTAGDALTGGQEIKSEQAIEAYDVSGVGFGTTSAKSLTVSFWIKSNQAADYVLWLYRSDGSRHNSAVYNINSADTWEFKTLTFAPDHSNTVTVDNTTGLGVAFILNTGPDFSSGTSTYGNWEALSNPDRYAGQTATIGSSTSDYFEYTGLQVELGKVATPFEHRSYAEELALCQRYYYRISGGDYTWICEIQRHNTSDTRGVISLPVALRAAPSISHSGLAYWYNNGSLSAGNSAIGLGYTDTTNMVNITQLNLLYTPTSNDLTNNGQTVAMLSFTSSPAWGSYLAFDAEL